MLNLSFINTLYLEYWSTGENFAGCADSDPSSFNVYTFWLLINL